jgi:ketosteroid isomerase-like protein
MQHRFLATLSATVFLFCVTHPDRPGAADGGKSCPDTPTTSPTQRFVDDMRAKNIRDVLTLYTPKALFIDADGKRYRGARASQQLYERVFATFDSDIEITAHFLSPGKRPNVCVESGRYSENLRWRSNGTVKHYVGSYRFTYERQSNGQWLLSRQEWPKT